MGFLDQIEPPDPARFTTLRRMLESGDHRLVVAFGGGAVPGVAGNLALAHLLDALDFKQHVAEIWGTSAGAIVAGGWASGSTALEIYELLRTLDRRGAIDVCWRKLALAVLMRPFGRPLPDGVVEGKEFRATIGAGLKVATFEECPIPFRCIGVRADGSLRRTVFRSGELLPSIFASMSIPGIVVPQPVDGESYYDGGLAEKTPLLSPIAEHARLGTGKNLLLVGTHFDNEMERSEARGFFARFLQTIYALEEMCWDYQLREARARDDVTLVLLNPKLGDTSLFKFSNAERNFVRGYRAFVDALQNAKIGFTFGTV